MPLLTPGEFGDDVVARWSSFVEDAPNVSVTMGRYAFEVSVND